MDKQEVFNRVYTHMMAMTKPSTIIDGCAYRGDDNNMCAIGCLMNDSVYRRSIEGFGIHNIYVQEALNESGIEIKDLADVHFLHQLQTIHDRFFSEREIRLRMFAEGHKLTIPAKE